MVKLSANISSIFSHAYIIFVHHFDHHHNLVDNLVSPDPGLIMISG